MGKAIVNKSSMSQPTIAPPPVQQKAIVNSYKKAGKDSPAHKKAALYDKCIERGMTHKSAMDTCNKLMGSSVKKPSKNGRVKSHSRIVRGKGNTSVRSHMRKTDKSKVKERMRVEAMVLGSPTDGAHLRKGHELNYKKYRKSGLIRSAISTTRGVASRYAKSHNEWGVSTGKNKKKVKSHARAIVN